MERIKMPEEPSWNRRNNVKCSGDASAIMAPALQMLAESKNTSSVSKIFVRHPCFCPFLTSTLIPTPREAGTRTELCQVLL